MTLFKKKNESKEYDEESNKPNMPSYLIPGILVTTLFFLWGFSYGLLDTLNKHFKNVLGLSKLTNGVGSSRFTNNINVQLLPKQHTCR